MFFGEFNYKRGRLTKGKMFFGEFNYKIDDKGRVPIPPRFRRELKDGVVLTAGAEKCINAYPLSEWKKLATALTGGSLTRSKLRRLNRAIFATAFSIDIDGQGRVALPVPLREYAIHILRYGTTFSGRKRKLLVKSKPGRL
jgi:division/cell wall cluster transcriptional repressor MraZ